MGVRYRRNSDLQMILFGDSINCVMEGTIILGFSKADEVLHYNNRKGFVQYFLAQKKKKKKKKKK